MPEGIRIAEVRGSIPLGSTKPFGHLRTNPIVRVGRRFGAMDTVQSRVGHPAAPGEGGVEESNLREARLPQKLFIAFRAQQA